jgi:hypothetical protein
MHVKLQKIIANEGCPATLIPEKIVQTEKRRHVGAFYIRKNGQKFKQIWKKFENVLNKV